MPYIRNRFIKNAVITSDKLVAGTIIAASLADNILAGSKLANVTYVAGAGTASAVVPGVPCVVALTIADAATADYLFTIPFKANVIDATVVQIGAGNAGNSVTLKNAADAITNGMNNASDKGISRATTLDTTKNTISAGANLTVAVVKAGGAAAVQVFVTLVRVA